MFGAARVVRRERNASRARARGRDRRRDRERVSKNVQARPGRIRKTFVGSFGSELREKQRAGSRPTGRRRKVRGQDRNVYGVALHPLCVEADKKTSSATGSVPKLMPPVRTKSANGRHTGPSGCRSYRKFVKRQFPFSSRTMTVPLVPRARTACERSDSAAAGAVRKVPGVVARMR